MFDVDPSLRPKMSPAASRQGKSDEESDHIQLSKQQENQITEIFNLFDTDGGGTIDKSELDFALVALGFKGRNAKKRKTATDRSEQGLKGITDRIATDGLVTLDEFTSLMKGELSGSDPWGDMRSVFDVLSKDDGNSQFRDLITFDKLVSVSKTFSVSLLQDEMEAMITEVDQDGGGSVDFNEFERILRSSAWY